MRRVSRVLTGLGPDPLDRGGLAQEEGGEAEDQAAQDTSSQ